MATYPLPVHFNPSTLKAGYNNATSKVITGYPGKMILRFSGVTWHDNVIQNDVDYTLLREYCPNYTPWYYFLLEDPIGLYDHMLHFRYLSYWGGNFFISVAYIRVKYYRLAYPEFIGGANFFNGICDNLCDAGGPNDNFYIQEKNGGGCATNSNTPAGSGGTCTFHPG